MASKTDMQHDRLGPLQRAAGAVKRLFTRGGGDGDAARFEPTETPRAAAAPRNETKTAAPAGRPVTRRADIPMDVIDNAYTPPRTSSKASFRSDGADHARDQEFAGGRADNDWNDEDRYTNKSGDPRIGTHGRTYDAEGAESERK